MLINCYHDSEQVGKFSITVKLDDGFEHVSHGHLDMSQETIEQVMQEAIAEREAMFNKPEEQPEEV